jgi:hypothetical protein
VQLIVCSQNTGELAYNDRSSSENRQPGDILQRAGGEARTSTRGHEENGSQGEPRE